MFEPLSDRTPYVKGFWTRMTFRDWQGEPGSPDMDLNGAELSSQEPYWWYEPSWHSKSWPLSLPEPLNGTILFLFWPKVHGMKHVPSFQTLISWLSMGQFWQFLFLWVPMAITNISKFEWFAHVMLESGYWQFNKCSDLCGTPGI